MNLFQDSNAVSILRDDVKDKNENKIIKMGDGRSMVFRRNMEKKQIDMSKYRLYRVTGVQIVEIPSYMPLISDIVGELVPSVAYDDKKLENVVLVVEDSASKHVPWLILANDRGKLYISSQSLYDRGYVPEKNKIHCGGFGCTYIGCIDKYKQCDRVIKIGNVRDQEVKNARKMFKLGLGPEIFDSFKVPIYKIEDVDNVEMDNLGKSVDNDYQAIVMEKYDGDFLILLKNKSLLSIDDGKKILDIYEKCRDKCILHKDLKMVNMLIRDDKGGRKIVMTDFMGLEILSESKDLMDDKKFVDFFRAAVLADWLFNMNSYSTGEVEGIVQSAYHGLLSSLYIHATKLFRPDAVKWWRDQVDKLYDQYIEEWNKIGSSNAKTIFLPSPRLLEKIIV